ncbi:MAG: serine/threonine-protein kinase [Myxococcota bacterium]
MATVLRRGSRLGKYRLERRIGRGSFADVWKARDAVEGVDVALKVTLLEAVREWGPKAIEHEARIAVRLHHPHIVGVRNADWIDGRFVMATDLAKTHLADYRAARRSGATALRIVREIAAGLAHAHSQRVLHRDVKPENILIFADGRAALADFGASRFAKGATQAYTEAGTLGYMAPEQAYGRVRFASDVFSLGLIAYEVLTGVLPTWPFEWPPEGHRSFAQKVPPLVQPVLRKAAQFDPRRRYPNAGEFVKALERAFARSEERSQRPAPRRRKKKTRGPVSPLEAQSAAFRRSHGKALELHFHCHRCNGPISEAMTFCPWCGSGDNSFAELTRAPLVCPECERGVRPEWTACPWCYAGRFEGNGRKPPVDPRAERACTKKGCDGQLRPFMRYCPRCKQKPKRVWSHPELPDRCPKCRWPTSHAYFRFCPWCARREPRAGSYRGR